MPTLCSLIPTNFMRKWLNKMVYKEYVPTSNSSSSYMSNNSYTYVDDTIGSPDNDSTYCYNTNVLYTGSMVMYVNIYSDYFRSVTLNIRSRKTGGSASKKAATYVWSNPSVNANGTVSTSYQTFTTTVTNSITSRTLAWTIAHNPAPIGYQIRTTAVWMTCWFDWKHKIFGQDTRKLRPFGKELKNIAKVMGVE